MQVIVQDLIFKCNLQMTHWLIALFGLLILYLFVSLFLFLFWLKQIAVDYSKKKVKPLRIKKIYVLGALLVGMNKLFILCFILQSNEQVAQPQLTIMGTFFGRKTQNKQHINIEWLFAQLLFDKLKRFFIFFIETAIVNWYKNNVMITAWSVVFKTIVHNKWTQRQCSHDCGCAQR